MNTRQIALVAAAAASAVVLFGRQRRERGELARPAQTDHHRQSDGFGQARRNRRR